MDQNNDDKVIDSSSRIKLEGEQQYVRPYYSNTPKVVQFVMKYSGGYIKDEQQASYVLIGFVVVAVVISLSLIFGGGGQELPPEKIM